MTSDDIETEQSDASWKWWIGPALLSLVLALIFLDPFLGDWDAVDYAVLALNGRPSSMALGRSFFIFFNRALWLVAHSVFRLGPDKAYLLFKYAVVAQAPLVIIACWYLARQLGATVRTATIACLLISTSPAFVTYSGQAMTEIPSLLILAVALLVHIKGATRRNFWLVVAGAALLGAGVNVRETVGFFAPWLVIGPLLYGWKFRKEIGVIVVSCAAFLLAALGPFALLYLRNVDDFRASWGGWRESMKMESARHPVTVANLLPFFVLMLLSSPLIYLSLPFAVVRELKQRRLSPPIGLGLCGIFATALLLLNYSTTINWRYFISALPVFAPLCAGLFMGILTHGKPELQPRAFRWVAALLLTFATVGTITGHAVFSRMAQKHSLTLDYGADLSHIPRDAVVIAGGQSVAINYWRGIGEGSWTEIGTGGGWPGNDLTRVIGNYLSNGRRVFIDTDPRLWSVCGWQASETETIGSIENDFKFRRFYKTIYEIFLKESTVQNESPHLTDLKAQNRKKEVAACVGNR